MAMTDVHQLAAWIDAARPLRLVDVRTPGEFESAQIACAVNLPLDRLATRVDELRQSSDPIVLICRSDQRARQAQAQLRHAGVRETTVLEGGMLAWEAAGLPVRRGRQRISLERQVRITAGGISAAGALLALTISSWFAVVPLIIGSGLLFSGVTDTCGMALVLARLPYNRASAQTAGD